jgi:hypothetical protein
VTVLTVVLPSLPDEPDVPDDPAVPDEPEVPDEPSPNVTVTYPVLGLVKLISIVLVSTNETESDISMS